MINGETCNNSTFVANQAHFGDDMGQSNLQETFGRSWKPLSQAMSQLSLIFSTALLMGFILSIILG